MRDFQSPGRSIVYATRGMAASSHPLSSLAAIETLRRGGNAIDAAVAAIAHQGVVEPMATGIGGDCFAIIWKAKEQRFVAINGSGWAPKGLSSRWMLDQGQKMALTSPHAVTVPGAVDAWCQLIADHGKLSLAQVLEPAIDQARHGFAITPNVAEEWRGTEGKLRASPNATRHYLPGGQAPKIGDIFLSHPMAEALEAVARKGRDGFYAGPVLDDMLSSLKAVGGTHVAEDFAAFRSEYVGPISSRYRGIELFELPPNDLGVTTSLMLNILERFDLKALEAGSAERYHLLLEASRIAFAVRGVCLGDPRFHTPPMARLLSAELADSLAKRISPKGPVAELPPAAALLGTDTVTVSVVDEERNIVSIVNSLFHRFGSGIATERYGIMFHNRGTGFVVEPGHPNDVEPRKRPAHTIMPAILKKDGKPWLSLGVKGGLYQPVGKVQIVTSLIDYGMDLQTALDFPRASYGETGGVDVERGVAPAAREALGAMGHPVSLAKEPLGGAQAIMIDGETGVLAGASDSRKDGAALGY